MSDGSLVYILTKIVGRIAEVERKQEGRIARGTVEEVDAKAGTVRIKVGEDDDGKPFLTPPIPYAQFMGALKAHTPPSKGQQMTVMADAGDYRQGLAIPMTQSDANKSPSEKGDENVVTFGQFKAEIRDKQMKVTVGGVVLDITDTGLKITVGGSSFELTGAGLKMVASDYQFD